jgi:hypothetical protein
VFSRSFHGVYDVSRAVGPAEGEQVVTETIPAARFSFLDVGSHTTCLLNLNLSCSNILLEAFRESWERSQWRDGSILPCKS